ncbi:DUF4238 domain-containing protein [Agrobacterium cavarae]|uniref:DUF4238 domain-containing protein n=1 Tax=Agrobacterium cavarae TaxID=2528239 RepID=UPI003EE706A4
MSKEGDHHYVPQFHLRMWEQPDGKIDQWGRIAFNNKLVCTSVTSAATAYVPGLYSLEHVNETEAQQIEKDIFGKIETEAKPVLAKLISRGAAKLSLRERYWWTIYLNASLLRVPHVVEKVKAGAKELVEKELSQDIPEYDAAKGDAPEATLFEWAAKHAPARLANSGLKVLVSLLSSEKAIDRIIHLHWLVRDVSAAPRRLLLGDNPFERVGDLYKPRTLISIPLSPTHVFFGSDAPDIVEHLAKLPAREVVKASNVSTLSTARKFVYGDAERGFIEQYLPVTAGGTLQS